MSLTGLGQLFESPGNSDIKILAWLFDQLWPVANCSALLYRRTQRSSQWRVAVVLGITADTGCIASRLSQFFASLGLQS